MGHRSPVVDEAVKQRILSNHTLAAFLQNAEIPEGKTIFDVLGVSPNASAAKIDEAYANLRAIKNELRYAPNTTWEGLEVIKESAKDAVVNPRHSAFEGRTPSLSSIESFGLSMTSASEEEFKKPFLKKTVKIPLRKFDALLSYIATGDTGELDTMSYRRRMELNKTHSKESVVSAREAAFKIFFDMLANKDLTDTKRERVIAAIFTVEEASGALRKRLGEDPQLIAREYEEVEAFLEKQFSKVLPEHSETQRAIPGVATPTFSSPVTSESSAASPNRSLNRSASEKTSPTRLVLSPVVSSLTVAGAEKKSVKISCEELSVLLRQYKSTAFFKPSPGPELKAIADLMIGKQGVTRADVLHAIKSVSEKSGSKTGERVALLTNPHNSTIKLKTGVSRVIQAIGEKFNEKEEAQKTISPK